MEDVEALGKERFTRFSERKTRAAIDAAIHPLFTSDDRSSHFGLRLVGSDWTRRFYDGGFHLFDPPANRPAISLVFVQSREGHTGASHPDELGGGPTDKHLIYEGVSRVAADAVLAGATTAAGTHVFFSVWHPELVRLRESLGLPRHPVQMVLSKEGRVDVDRTLLFNVPDVPVVILAGAACQERCQHDLATRPWITVIPIEPGGLAAAFARLRHEHHIRRISAIGGRAAASSLIDAGLVQDLWLTTSAIAAGQPDTPFYVGQRQPSLAAIVRKQETGTDQPMTVEHLALLSPWRK